MNVVSLFLSCAALLAGVTAIRFTPPPLSLVFATGCLAFSAYALLVPERAQKIVARLKGLRWRRSGFCRGWLITGDTGAGKTTSGINQLAWQVFTHEPTWGGPAQHPGDHAIGSLAEHFNFAPGPANALGREQGNAKGLTLAGHGRHTSSKQLCQFLVSNSSEQAKLIVGPSFPV